MRKRFSVELENGEKLVQELIQRGKDVEAILGLAANAGAAVVMEIADANAPVPGAVAKETVETTKRAVAIVAIGVESKRWYLQFFETGATEHEIKGSDKPLVFEGDDGKVVTWIVDHPGMGAQPFLRPALDGQKTNATNAVGEVIKGNL